MITKRKLENPKNNLIDINKHLQQKRLIESIYADATWQQVKASFALSGIAISLEDADLVGKILKNEFTLEQVFQELECRLGLKRDD